MSSDSATYLIQVEGHLDASWSDRMGGLAIETSSEPGGPVVTTLQGSLQDQSALSGILNALVDLQFALVSVRGFDFHALPPSPIHPRPIARVYQ